MLLLSVTRPSLSNPWAGFPGKLVGFSETEGFPEKSRETLTFLLLSPRSFRLIPQPTAVFCSAQVTGSVRVLLSLTNPVKPSTHPHLF